MVINHKTKIIALSLLVASLFGCVQSGNVITNRYSASSAIPGFSCPGIPFEAVQEGEVPFNAPLDPSSNITVQWVRGYLVNPPRSNIWPVRQLECFCWSNTSFNERSGTFLQGVVQTAMSQRRQDGIVLRITSSQFSYVDGRALVSFEATNVSGNDVVVYGKLVATGQCMFVGRSAIEAYKDPSSAELQLVTHNEKSWIAKIGTEPSVNSNNNSIENRLKALQELRDKNLISEQEYISRRRVIIESL